jgi:16S rRNA (cytidine1402-2'-O)-methyltransferase
VSLTLISVPIGNLGDITLRAVQLLKEAELIIGEETKPLFQLFRDLGLPRPEKAEFLNEHSKDVDLEFFLEQCKTKKVALVTDCGTPGFCDPGAALVKLCRQHKVPVTTAPGASSLMVLLSLSGLDLKEFYFRGFLPANNEKRAEAVQELKKFKCPVVVMDTPYRFQAMMKDLKSLLPDYKCLLGLDLTAENERIIDTPLRNLDLAGLPEKAEFILIIYK